MRLLYFLSFLVGPLLATAQHKVNVDLWMHYQRSSIQEKQTHVPMLIRGDYATVAHVVEGEGGQIRYQAGDIMRVDCPLALLPTLCHKDKIQRIEAHRLAPVSLNDSMYVYNRVGPVHLGTQLPNAYKGKGVLLGVIDDGFELAHPDFWEADSSTRFLSLWDQTLQGAGFEPSFGYGSAWDKQEIDQGLAVQVPLAHGTHVLGTAAGNARAAQRNMGVAPEASIAAVKISNNYFLQRFADAVAFIFEQADALGMPCVINSSVGTYYGSHDGRDLTTEFIDQLLTARSGRALVQAAGNGRASDFHAQLSVQQDTASIAFQPLQSQVHFSFFADSQDLSRLRFSFILMDAMTRQVKGYSKAYNVRRDYVSATAADTLREQLFSKHGQAVEIYSVASAYKGVYEVYVELPTLMLDEFWALQIEGTGKIDIWSDEELLNSSNFMESGLPHSVPADNLQSIVSSWTCSEQVITVASYQNRAYLHNYFDDTVYLGTPGWPVQEISHFSSIGPTRDGRVKPDITAPGGRVLSAAPLSVLNTYKNNRIGFLDRGGWHIVNRGTSMSAPMVAGAVALFLESQPNAHALQIKQAVQQSARQDNYFWRWGGYPNIHWGYGKLDVQALMHASLIYGCTDSLSSNFNPLANVDDGSCLPVYTRQVSAPHPRIFPNPAQAFYTIQYPFQKDMHIVVFDMLGRQVYSHACTAPQDFFTVYRRNLPAATYFCTIQQGPRVLHRQAIQFID